MRERIVVVALALVSVAIIADAQERSAGTVQVPKATPVVVQTGNAINSATFHNGERLAYVVTNDVVVDGMLIVRAGDTAVGTVQDATQGHSTHAGRAGMLLGPVGAAAGAATNKATSKGSNLRVSVTGVTTFCGAHIPLAFVRSEYHKPKRFGQPAAVQIAKGQKYVATVAYETTTCGVATTRTASPIPPDALAADPSPGPRH